MADNIYGVQQNPYFAQPQATFYQNRPTAKYTQPLTDGQINALRQEEDALTVKVDEKDIWRAQCTHKHNGASTLTKVPVYDRDGNLIREDYKCSICGAQFTMFDGTVEDVKAALKTVNDILQTCKTVNLDIPAELASAYFQFIPLLNMLPVMYDRSVRNFQRYANVENAGGVYAGNTYMQNNWGLLGSLTAQPYYGQPVGYAQPQVVYPQAAPAGYVYPQQQVVYQYPQPQAVYPQQQVVYQQPAQANPFVANAPAPGVIPQPAPAPQAAPVQPAPETQDVAQNKAFNL